MILKSHPMAGRSPLAGGPCWLCRRRDEGVGFVTSGRNPHITFSCHAHLPLGGIVSTMPKAEYDPHEQDAMWAAANAGGEYLASIGQTDLAKLDDMQLIIFTKLVIDTFGLTLEASLQAKGRRS